MSIRDRVKGSWINCDTFFFHLSGEGVSGGLFHENGRTVPLQFDPNWFITMLNDNNSGILAQLQRCFQPGAKGGSSVA